MRLEEICQLRLEDVYKEGTVDIIRVTLSKETKLKTVTSQRIVPIHENLKRVGFFEYCNYMKKQKKERVFWDLTKSRDGYGRNIGRYFMEYLRKVGVYEFQSKVFHSLRHSFITNFFKMVLEKKSLMDFVDINRKQCLQQFTSRVDSHQIYFMKKEYQN